MNVGEFGSMMTQKGCVGNGQSFCGSFSGYPFTSSFISGKAGGKTTASLQMQFNKTLPGKMRKQILKAHRGQVKLFYPNQNYYYMGGAVGAAVAASNSSQYKQTNLSLSITARTPEEFSNLLDSVLASIVAAAPTYGLFIPDICPICKKANCDSFAFINGAYVAAHANCVQQDLAKQQEKVEKNLREGSYGLGFIGALLGALIGSIPAVLILSLTGYLVFLLYMLIPIASYQGYKILKGKRTKSAVLFVFLATILVLPIMGYLQFVLPDYINYGQWYSPAIYLNALAYAGMSNILAAYGLQIIVVIIGLAVSYSSIKRTGQDEVFDKAFSANTLRPINAFVYNQPMQQIAPQQPVAPAVAPEIAQPTVLESSIPTAAPSQASTSPQAPTQDTTNSKE